MVARYGVRLRSMAGPLVVVPGRPAAVGGARKRPAREPQRLTPPSNVMSLALARNYFILFHFLQINNPIWAIHT